MILIIIFTASDSLYQHQNYRGKKTPLGTLNIVATKDNVYQQLIDTVVVILISQAIKTFLVSLFILIIFYYLITRHLKKIAQHSAELELESRPSLLTLDRNNSNSPKSDELDLMVESINRMSENIYDSYQQLINNQHQLVSREAEFSAMFNSMSDAIIFADSERNILKTNTAFRKQFGYSEEDLKDKTTLMLYANPDEYSVQGRQRYNAETKTLPSVYEIEYRRKDGTIFPSETMGGAVLSPDGTQIGLIGIIRDISGRKQIEKEKIQLQKELQQSQKMEAIGQLTGGIAHDFNNILASILGYSELATKSLQDSTDPKLKRYIEHIEKAGQRARDLVAQLLAFSRSAPSEPQRINVPHLIKDVTSLIYPTIPSSIKLVTKIDEHVPDVLMDNSQIHQTLLNLCINARDAMQGYGTLTIELTHESDVNAICTSCKEPVQGEFVKLTVKDTGTGIEANTLGRIFDPFLTTKEVGKGTGMGLSVVHGILHKHQSHIIVETELGVGSCFHLLIPPANEHNIDPIEEQPPVMLSQKNNKDKHILVVDDEESIAMFLQDFLQIHNYKVTYTTSSQQAIDWITQSTAAFDLIITDQTMPEMTGTDMVKHIFQINPDIPVILCSGYNEQIDEKEALQRGFSKYLNKPINSKVLLQAINEALVISKAL